MIAIFLLALIFLLFLRFAVERGVVIVSLLTLALAVASGFGLGGASALLLVGHTDTARGVALAVLALGVALSAASIWMARRWMQRDPLVWIGWPLFGGLVGFFGFWLWLLSTLRNSNMGE